MGNNFLEASISISYEYAEKTIEWNSIQALTCTSPIQKSKPVGGVGNSSGGISVGGGGLLIDDVDRNEPISAIPVIHELSCEKIARRVEFLRLGEESRWVDTLSMSGQSSASSYDTPIILILSKDGWGSFQWPATRCPVRCPVRAGAAFAV